MAEKRFEYRYATEDELEEMKQREFTGWMFTYVCYIKYPRVRNRDDPWVTVTRLNPRGRVQGSSELEDALQPSTSDNCSAAEDLAGVGLVVDLTDFGEEAAVHVEDEPVIGEFHQDPDSDSSEIPRKFRGKIGFPRNRPCRFRDLSLESFPRNFLGIFRRNSEEDRVYDHLYKDSSMSNDDQTRPRLRRGRGGKESQSRDSSHFQDSLSPHSSYHTSPSAAPAPTPLAPAAAPAAALPGPPGVMSVAELSVPKKKGRLVGLGRRTRSVPPSSAPPPFVDPEVLTAQLKDKDDRISLLETQMAAQQAGYEAQRRLNQQMMEMMQRMYPNEVFPNVQDP
uniref:Uncharacterized protein n=1 Tax=Brassica oleracea var. oleracea TaxID=109376 RepID=A0A0D3DKC1_BRAOL